MKKLIIKSSESSHEIDNPGVIPSLYSKIVTKEIPLGRVIDIEYNYVTQEVTVLVEIFKD